MKKLKFYFIKTAIYVTCVDLKTSRSFYSALTLLYFFIYFQRPVFSLGVSQHMHKITNLWKFELDWSSELRDNYERKNTLITRSCMLDFETSNSILEVSKSNWWKILSFSKTTPLQRDLFLTMFYITNLSPLLVTK